MPAERTHTFTLDPGAVQRETFGAFAVEASRRVDAGGAGAARAALGGALVVVCGERGNTGSAIKKSHDGELSL